jgi:uncharacterized protein YuzE
MKIIYDPDTDTLTIILKEGKIAESDEDKPGIILDYDGSGELISLEILSASEKVFKPGGIEYQIAM